MWIANSRKILFFLGKVSFFVKFVVNYRKKKIQQRVNQDEDEWAKGELDEDEMLPAN
jgi:hypothetical protein